MATYKILEIGSNSALVEIDFGTPLFNDYDAKEKPVRVSTQRFKVDDLRPTMLKRSLQLLNHLFHKKC